MEVKAGCYYRTHEGRVVKVLHEEVYWLGGTKPNVVYRYREGDWPTKAECVSLDLFIEAFEGPLGWDIALKEFK